jgi:hypothetical protein
MRFSTIGKYQMTIISTIISRCYTVHATDSLITIVDDKGNNIAKEEQKSKIVKVDAFNGIMSFWGLGWYEYKGREVYTRDWLAERAMIARKFKNPEDFAKFIADELQYLRQLGTGERLENRVNSAQTGDMQKNVSQ